MKLSHSVLPLVALAFVSLVGCGDHEAKGHAAASTAAAAPTSAVGNGETRPAVATATDAPSVTPAVETTKHSDPKEAKVASESKAHGFSVKRIVVARGVEGREPQGVSTAFWKGDFDKLYAFVELANPEKEAGKVVVTFVPPSGKAPKGNVTLAVGATPRFRTWAYSSNVDQKGTWTAVVSTTDGKELAHQAFDIL